MDIFSKDSFNSENLSKLYDLTVDFIKTNPKPCYYGVGFVAVLFVYYKFGKDAKQRIFVWMNSKSADFVDKSYENLRIKLCAPLKTLKSHDPELQKENAIRILEIGVGCGSNFDYYPEGSHLVLVDPNPHFHQHFMDKVNGPLTSFKVKQEDLVVATGEEMNMVKSGSIDAVVVTLVLCSVSDVSKVVSQVKRVLAPGGKFLFMEHVTEFEPKKHRLRRILQTLLTATRIWPFLFEGCCLTRNPLPILKNFGFTEVEGEYLHAPITCTLFKIASPHLIGYATK